MKRGDQNPTVSVVVPCFNACEALPVTIEALLRQSYVPDEIIVVDDGSQDESASIGASYGDPVRVVRQANAGSASARHRGVTEAKGEIVVFNDAGDVSLNDRVECLRAALVEHPVCVASFGITWVKTRPIPEVSWVTNQKLDGRVTVVENPLERMLAQSWPLAIGMNIAVRRQVAITGTAVSSFYRAANDYALQIQTARYGPFAHVASVSMEYIETVGGISSRNGYIQQTAYALCAAREVFEAERRNRRLDSATFFERVELEWPGLALHMYLRRRSDLMWRVIRIGLRYGRLNSVPRRFWWALDQAAADGQLSERQTLRIFAQLLARLRG